MASNKRERELARMRAERQAARRAAEEARRRQRRNGILAGVAALAVVAVVVTVALVAGLGGTDKSKTTTATGTFGNLGGTGSCAYTKTGAASKKVAGVPPTKNVKATGTQKVTFETSRGTITANLLTSKAPCTVNSLAFLAQQGYYDDTPCHRLTTSGIFVVQCGDPTGKGTGGPGYQYADENLTGATYPKGTLAMANGGAGTNGSQFFLVYKDTQLPPSYTPFGTITGGLDVLTKVAAGGTTDGSGDGAPKLALSLKKVTVA